jgi:hypothetical protein
MSDKTKKIIIGAISGTIIVSGGFWVASGFVHFCDSAGSCHTLTQSQYNELKTDLTSRVAGGGSLTIGEYQMLVAIYDFEIQKNNFVFENVSLPNLLGDLNRKVIQTIQSK